MIRFDVLSIFPDMFSSPLNYSLLKKAQDKDLIEIFIHNIRDWAEDKHKMTDDAPYGSGCGMVMKVGPVDKALVTVKKKEMNPLVILMTPQGELFNQRIAAELATKRQIVIICGRYEGVDERIRRHLADREISIGDYILTGGEIPAMALIEGILRLLPGVIHNKESLEFESFEKNLLEYPQYTRPVVFEGLRVPEVLLSGNHQEISKWRLNKSTEITKNRRPDLFDKSV